MLKLERYEIKPASNCILIRINQKKNVLVNIFISASVIGVASYLIATSEDASFFYYVLLGIGVLWLIGGVMGFRSKRSYNLTDRIIEFHSSSRNEPRTLQTSNLSHIVLHKIIRPTGNPKKGTLPLESKAGGWGE